MSRADYSWFHERCPRVLPVGWELVDVGHDGRKWTRTLPGGHLWSVIMSGDVELDGRRWIHLSTAMRHRLPNYGELVEVRDLFLGRECKALQVFAPASEHVNIHPNCLHLWHCVDGDPLPDFTRGGDTL